MANKPDAIEGRVAFPRLGRVLKGKQVTRASDSPLTVKRVDPSPYKSILDFRQIIILGFREKLFIFKYRLDGHTSSDIMGRLKLGRL